MVEKKRVQSLIRSRAHLKTDSKSGIKPIEQEVFISEFKDSPPKKATTEVSKLPKLDLRRFRFITNNLDYE